MLAAVLALLLGALPPAPGGDVRGRIVDGSTNEPVAGAYVTLVGDAVARELRTGAAGEYAFTDLVPGVYRLQVAHPGYGTAGVSVMLREGSDVVLDVPLDLRPIEFRPIQVAAARDRATGAMPTAADSVALALRAQRPGGFGPQGTSALADMVAGGVKRDAPNPDGSRNAHVLYIWGSSGERGRVLIDGAALNGPLHLGGMLPPVDPELLSAAELRSGGVSPRHDGGTTYVMDFATRPARSDGVHVSGEADLLTGRIAAETPLGGRGGVIVGARRVNHELVDRLLGRPFGYGYDDVLARGDYALGASGRLQATVFTTRESIDIPRDLGHDEASWRNVAAALAWHATGTGAFRTARISYGRGTADLPLLSAPDGHLRATLERFAAGAERTWEIGNTAGVVGAEIEHLTYDRASSAAFDPTTPVALAVRCTQTLPCARAATTGFAAFGEASWRVGGSWSARAGARLAYEGAKPSVQLMPRVALTGLIGEHGLVTISAGRFSQPYAFTPTATPDGGEAPLALDNTTVVHAHATHVELNLVQRSGRNSMSATAFLRRHDAQTPGAEARATPGVDLSWTYDAGTFSGSIGYSFARSPVVVLADDSVRNRHLVAAGVAAARGPFVLQASAAYGAGLPLASLVLENPDQLADGIHAESPSLYGGTNVPERTKPPRNYLRLDASLGAQLRFRTRGRDAVITPYIKIMNALSDREALFYYHEAQIGGEARPLATLPAIPVFGLRWSF